ncbi:hypothetical protein Tco_0971583 [Tanacetum coccineum]
MASSAEALIVEYAFVPTPLLPLPSPLSTLSSPLPRIPSPLLLSSPPHTSPPYASAPLCYKAALVKPLYRFERELASLLPLPASEGRAMTAVEEVNEGVTDLATTQRQDAHELQVSLLTRERRYFRSIASSYEREVVHAREAWSHSEDRSTTLEASIKTLEAQARDKARPDDLEDTRSSLIVKKILPKRTTTPMTDAAIKQLIAQGVADVLAEHEAVTFRI